MNNIMLKLKRFLGNKNTVTILGIVAGVAVLLIGYNFRVNQAVKPIDIPYALVKMEAKSKVEAENVGTIKVSGAFIEQTPDLITSRQYIIAQEWYVNYDTSIPEGGLFYKQQLIRKEDLPNTAYDNIPDGATVFSLSVDSHSTYGNSMMPGDKIDLYIKAVDDNGKIIFGKFIKEIEVLLVRDSEGKDVFANSDEERDSSELIFAVGEDLYMLLREASFISGVEIIPVPRNATYREEGSVGEGGSESTGASASREELVNYILSKVSELSDPIDLNGIIKNENDLNINNDMNMDNMN